MLRFSKKRYAVGVRKSWLTKNTSSVTASYQEHQPILCRNFLDLLLLSTTKVVLANGALTWYLVRMQRSVAEATSWWRMVVTRALQRLEGTNRKVHFWKLHVLHGSGYFNDEWELERPYRMRQTWSDKIASSSRTAKPAEVLHLSSSMCNRNFTYRNTRDSFFRCQMPAVIVGWPIHWWHFPRGRPSSPIAFGIRAFD